MLADRDLRILRYVVDIHVGDGVPVSSMRVKRTVGLDVSTATIRNAMARLERAGLLCKPHASAGRIPTDEGYRKYVDGMDVNTRYGDQFATRLRDELRDRPVDLATIMACASRILGALSRNLAVVYGTVSQESVVRGLRIVPLEESRLLVIVHLEPDREQTAVLRLDRDVDPDVVARVEAHFSEALRDRIVSDAKDILRSSIRDNFTEEGIVEREIAIHRDSVFSERPAVELYFEERDHMAEGGWSDPGVRETLLRLLHNKPYLTRVLSDRSDQGTCVTIGQENGDQLLRPLSLVTAGYNMGAARGTLGVIGPTRMRYDLVQGLVGAAARELRALGEEYF